MSTKPRRPDAEIMEDREREILAGLGYRTRTGKQRGWTIRVKNRFPWRLSSLLLREPEDREQLIDLLRSAHARELLDADALSITEVRFPRPKRPCVT